MARHSTEPRYYSSKGGYFAVLKGRRIPLAYGPEKDPETKKAAWEQFRKEQAAARTEVEGDHGTAGQILNAYYRDCETRKLTENTLEWYFDVLQGFILDCGKVKAKELRARHIREFLAKQKTWGDSTKKKALEILAGAFNWAENEELISRSPFRRKGGKDLDRPIVDYRAKRAAISEEEHEAILDVCGRRSKKDFYWLCRFWWGTGARPAELALARADEWDENLKAFVIRAADPKNRGRYKLARYKKDRVIYLPDDLVPAARKLVATAERRKEGYLFTNQRGEPFTAKKVMERFASIRQTLSRRKVQVRPGLTAYSYRHAFVTRWLVAGGDSQKLCQLINTSLIQLHRHYSHLFEKHEALRDALNGFTAPRSTPDSPSVLPLRAAGAS
jgi:integrase